MKKNKNGQIFTIGFVGRYAPEKDFDNLFRSISMAQNNIRQEIKIICIGKNMSYNNISLCKKINCFHLRNKTRLLGEKKNLSFWYNSFDVLVLSSLMEAFPNVLLEAMACGTPCIATNVGDSKVIVNGCGWVVPPQNPRLLAKAILEACKEKKSGKIIEKQIKSINKIKNRFDLSRMVNRYQQLWAQICTEKT